MARKTLREEVIAHCLLVTCRVHLYKDKIELPIEFLQESLKESFVMYQSCNDNDHYGQVTLLQAKLSRNVESIKFGWKAFLDSKPFLNEAGLVECCDWLVTHGDLRNLQILQSAVRGIGYMFNVCHALLEPNTQSNMERVLKYDHFYGLEPFSQDKLVIHTAEKPMCMEMIKNMFKSKSETKKKDLEVQKTEVHEKIVIFLLNRARNWLKPIEEALKNMRDDTMVCEYYQAGIECPHIGDVDNTCRNLHSVQTSAGFQKLIAMDLLMIVYEANVHDSAANLWKKCPSAVKVVLEENYVYDADIDPTIKYPACLLLWNDLMPSAGHPLLVGRESKLLLEYIRKDKEVIVHLKKYLLDTWRMFTAGDKKLRSNAARETDGYLVFEFGYHLFGFDMGKRMFEYSPKDEMTKLERIFDDEVASRANIVKNEKYYTLMMDRYHGGRVVNVTCVAHRFTDAYSLISKNGCDPFEAMMKFSKFQTQLSMRNNTDFHFYPDTKNYLMWLEFYTCVAIFLIAKLRTMNFSDFFFILPSNYFALIEFIQATFPTSGHSVYDSVGRWMPSYHTTESTISDRLKRFSFVVSGHAQGIRILDNIIEECAEDACKYGLLERLLILSMTMVCNVGKSIPPESEISLMSSMSHITLPNKPSKRLENILESVKACKGITDLADVLNHFLKERGKNEELLVCRWNMGKKPTIVKTALQNYNLFEASFLNDKTFPAMKGFQEPVMVNVAHVDTDVDDDQEEIERGRKDKEAQVMKENLNTAVLYVQRVFRAKQVLRRLRKEKGSQKESTNVEDSVFEAIKVDDKMCGICRVIFQDKLQERLKLENDVLIGGTSVLNAKSSEASTWGMSGPQRQVSQELKQPAWGSSQENCVESPELKKLQLKDIRLQHMQEDTHIQKETELTNFKKKYMQEIAPNLKKLKEFLYNSTYNLTSQDYVDKNYPLEQMAIGRMIKKNMLIEKEVQLLLRSRMWSLTAGFIEQKMMELETDFATVKPYVETQHTEMKKQVL